MDDFDPTLDFGDPDDVEWEDDDYCYDCGEYLDETGLCGCDKSLKWDDDAFRPDSEWERNFRGTRLG